MRVARRVLCHDLSTTVPTANPYTKAETVGELAMLFALQHHCSPGLPATRPVVSSYTHPARSFEVRLC